MLGFKRGRQKKPFHRSLQKTITPFFDGWLQWVAGCCVRRLRSGGAMRFPWKARPRIKSRHRRHTWMGWGNGEGFMGIFMSYCHCHRYYMWLLATLQHYKLIYNITYLIFLGLLTVHHSGHTLAVGDRRSAYSLSSHRKDYNFDSVFDEHLGWSVKRWTCPHSWWCLFFWKCRKLIIWTRFTYFLKVKLWSFFFASKDCEILRATVFTSSYILLP